MNRFDDWEVDCGDCQHYWDDSCIGVPIEQKRNCTAFVATKKVDIPVRIERIESEVRGLRVAIGILGTWLLVTWIMLLVRL